MKLTFAQLCPLIHGAMVVEDRDSVYMSRFLSEYKPLIQGSGADEYRAESLTSVHLDMVTDARKLTIDYTNAWNTTGRPFFFFDLWIDGVLTEHQGYFADITRPIPRQEPDGTVTFPLPEGSKRVSVYFPELFHLELSGVSLDGASFVKPYCHKKTILALGDSITEGHDVCYAGMDYIDQLGMAMDAEVINFGLGGARLYPPLVEKAMLPACDMVTVALGTNDVATQEEAFRKNLELFFRKLYQAFPEEPVYVITPLWRADLDEKQEARLVDYRRQIAQEGEKYPNFQVIDGWKCCPHHPDFFQDRTVHPNDLGHTVYAKNLIREILGKA